MKLSIIVPAYNEQANVKAFFDAVSECFTAPNFTDDYELIFVDDGSKDGTLQELESLNPASENQSIKVITFSRNFGKEAAVYAGLNAAAGEYCAIIDCDLQQLPQTLLEMYNLLIESKGEYDCVAACQTRDNRRGLKGKLSDSFYKVLGRSSNMEVLEGASDFRVFDKKVRDALLSMTEANRFSKGMFSWVGFKTLAYPYVPDERHAGETSWSFRTLTKYATDGLLSFTTVPLKIASYVGAVAVVLALIYLIYVIVGVIAFGIDVPGYATLVALIVFFGGVQMLFLGVIGEYIGRIYIQGKNRPPYIVASESTKNYSEDD